MRNRCIQLFLIELFKNSETNTLDIKNKKAFNNKLALSE